MDIAEGSQSRGANIASLAIFFNDTLVYCLLV